MTLAEPANKAMKLRFMVLFGGTVAVFVVNFGLILAGHYRLPFFVLIAFLVGIPLVVKRLPPLTTDPQQIRANQLKAASSARFLGWIYVLGFVLGTLNFVSHGTHGIPPWVVVLCFGWSGFLIWTCFRLSKRLRKSATTFQSGTES